MTTPLTTLSSAPSRPFDNLQKQRKGISRVLHAARYSLSGLRHGWSEPAFRLEALATSVLLPAAFWLGRTWAECAVLAGSLLLVMVVELLNTAIEVVVDRIGLEEHALSGRAKDLGSAAVFLSLCLALCTWVAAIASRAGN